MISLSGCLFSYEREKILREEEPLHAARFETPQAQQAFNARAMSETERLKTERTDSLAVPFLLGLKYKRTVSQNAFYNDQLALCDSNKDGLISVAEAEAYNPSATLAPVYPSTQPAYTGSPPPLPMAQPASVQSPHTDIRFLR